MDPGVDVGRFVSGIYNPCDRWCERCPMTAKGVVRSVAALRDAYDRDRGLQDQVFLLLADLDWMRKQIEVTFPGCEDLTRPGFDAAQAQRCHQNESEGSAP